MGINKILMFPVDYNTGKEFLYSVKGLIDPNEKVDVLLLKKQSELYDYLSIDTMVNKIYTLNEPLYHITEENSLELIKELAMYKYGFFPNTVFNGNISVLALCIAKEVTIINTYHNERHTINLYNLLKQIHLSNDLHPNVKIARSLINHTKEKLTGDREFYSNLKSKQRSDLGFISGFPSHTERMFSYLKLMEYLDKKSCRVLKIGSGTGHYAYILSHFAKEYIAFDIDKFTIDNCNKLFQRHGLKYIDDNNKIEGEFDLIILYEIIEHVENPGDFILAFAKYLENNGTLVISTPNYKIFHYVALQKNLRILMNIRILIMMNYLGQGY